MNWGRIVGILGNFFGNCGDLSEIVGDLWGGIVGSVGQKGHNHCTFYFLLLTGFKSQALI